jgi:hypothetical protein
MTTEYTAFTGCSYTKGIGLPGINCDKNLWVNILHSSLTNLAHTKLLNLGSGGSTNTEIFQRSVDALCSYNCKYLFVAWTSLYRYRFSLGTELYDVTQYWSLGHPLIDVMINPNIKISAQFLTDLKNKFFTMHHDHCEIVKILTYTATLNRLAQKTNTQVFFINAMLPWDSGYFDQVLGANRLPSDTTLYTQNLLNAETRDDQEFFQIYDGIHQDYADSQGLENCDWLNLDSGFKEKFMLDVGNDGSHPGEQSHCAFAEHLIKSYTKFHGNK